jgi:hypothetical protein
LILTFDWFVSSVRRRQLSRGERKKRKYDRLQTARRPQAQTLGCQHSLQQVRETTVGSLFIFFLTSILCTYNNIKEGRRKQEKKLNIQPPWSNVEVADRTCCCRELLVSVQLVELLLTFFFLSFHLSSNPVLVAFFNNGGRTYYQPQSLPLWTWSGPPVTQGRHVVLRKIASPPGIHNGCRPRGCPCILWQLCIQVLCWRSGDPWH